ncbi:MAG: WG repeat-containing protein [Flavobacteriales bacterium]|nr:WG repeat-containing protein [Flavobacteriales bacterium]
MPCSYLNIIKVYHDIYAGFGGPLRSKFVNSKGDLLHEGLFYRIYPASNGLILCQGRGHVFLNLKFENQMNTVYQHAYPFIEGYTSVKRNGSYVIINQEGDELSIPGFSSLEPLAINTFMAKEAPLFGLYNNKGELILAPIYEHIRILDNEIIQVQKIGKVGYLKPNGEWLYNPFISPK